MKGAEELGIEILEGKLQRQSSQVDKAVGDEKINPVVDRSGLNCSETY